MVRLRTPSKKAAAASVAGDEVQHERALRTAWGGATDAGDGASAAERWQRAGEFAAEAARADQVKPLSNKEMFVWFVTGRVPKRNRRVQPGDPSARSEASSDVEAFSRPD